MNGFERENAKAPSSPISLRNKFSVFNRGNTSGFAK